MTRASHGSAPVFRAMNTKRTGGNYPQWMRTLEEKYQKLHRKITENTAVGVTPFSHGVGKSVYDTRLSHVLLKYRDLGSAKVNSKPGLTTKKGGNVPNECDTNTGLAEQKGNCKSNTSIGNIENDVITKQAQSHNTSRQNRTVDKAGKAERERESDSPDHVSSYSEESFEDCKQELEKIYTRKVSLENNGEQRVSNEQDSARVPVDDKQFAENSRFVQHEEDERTRRNVKTSFSRTSKLTSRSCPAKIQSKSAVNSKSTESTALLSRNVSAKKRTKMFTAMSEEAKHAITETIQEMNISTDPRRESTKTGVNYTPSRTRQCVKNWTVPRPVKPNVVYKAEPVVTKKLDELNDDGVKCGTSNNGGDCSMRSSAGSSTKERLPDIQNDGISESRNQLRKNNQSYRLPGIGKYDIAQTDLFEITPPGFDIRYNDMQVVEERESETPPPDIRKIAIEKCSEWLIKYNK